MGPARLEILSVNVGEPGVLLRHAGGEVISAIDKRPASKPELDLSAWNLSGDAQADTRRTPAGDHVHGGPNQAVYTFPAEHYDRIEELTTQATWHGFMGENITSRGATEDEVCIGDRWSWGSAILQVTAPRTPCFKLGIRLGRQALSVAVRQEGLTGWYLRVLSPGRVPTSGEIEVERHPDGVTVADVQRALNDVGTTYDELSTLEPLSPNVRWLLRSRDRDMTFGVPEAD